ncbi:MAG: lamin tail domain-containing protein, partial [Holophagales bacterium]|nr:lamin tail domain-containing protein [Holophagales bacterium]
MPGIRPRVLVRGSAPSTLRGALRLSAGFAAFTLLAMALPAAVSAQVVISEVAWMGTDNSTSDEWIELHNRSASSVDLTGWTLEAADGTPSISLSGSIPAGGYMLLERTDDTTVPGVTADLIYTGALSNSGEDLVLWDDLSAQVDRVDAWHAGDNSTKATQVRIDSLVAGTLATNWRTGSLDYGVGYGTPGEPNAPVVISEVAWMGTTGSASDEWIELY